MTLAYVVTIIAFVAGVIWLSIHADHKATRRRADRLSLRDAVSPEVWRQSLPDIPLEELERITSLIAGVLHVPANCLRPHDTFSGEMALADRFRSLVIDDDTTEEICDAVEDQYGARPGGEWNDIKGAVLEIWKLLDNNHIGEQDETVA